jgi:hypothetical protein
VLSAAGPSLGPSARSPTENAMNPYYLPLGHLDLRLMTGGRVDAYCAALRSMLDGDPTAANTTAQQPSPYGVAERAETRWRAAMARDRRAAHYAPGRVNKIPHFLAWGRLPAPNAEQAAPLRTFHERAEIGRRKCRS